MDFFDYHTHKIRCSLASLDQSSLGTMAMNAHKLSKYENKLKDKLVRSCGPKTLSFLLKRHSLQGFRQTLLRIPLPDARIGVPAQRRPSLYVMNHYEKRQAGDGQSPPRKHLDEEVTETGKKIIVQLAESGPPNSAVSLSAYEALDTDSNIDSFSEASSSAKPDTCQALYDFEPQQEDQLTIYAGTWHHFLDLPPITT